jgi:hypothetical protein
MGTLSAQLQRELREKNLAQELIFSRGYIGDQGVAGFSISRRSTLKRQDTPAFALLVKALQYRLKRPQMSRQTQ